MRKYKRYCDEYKSGKEIPDELIYKLIKSFLNLTGIHYRRAYRYIIERKEEYEKIISAPPSEVTEKQRGFRTTYSNYYNYVKSTENFFKNGRYEIFNPQNQLTADEIINRLRIEAMKGKDEDYD